jgi:hypothetical protein
MPVNRERRRVIKQTVAHIREHLGEASTEHNEFAQCESLSEVLGLLIAFCRAEQVDEVLVVEVLVRALDTDREQLDETAAILGKLGYHRVAPILRRLAKRARPRPPSGLKRLRMPFHVRIAAREAV